MNLDAAKLDELINRAKPATNACKWRQWYVNLTQDEKTTIQTAFNNPEIETSHLVRALQEYGCPSSPTTIRSHRRQECKSCT
jgi:hypothetical protein